MAVLLDLVLDSLPPSKNARTRMNTRTGHVYTEQSVREWMNSVIVQTRLAKTEDWYDGREVWMKVDFTCTGDIHLWDVDGALPCLIDAVMLGMLSSESTRTRSPDGWIMWIQATKRLFIRDTTRVIVGEGDVRGSI